MDSKPLVTVFTLVHYTNPKFVIEAIDSIYNQTYKNIEHIIINDAPDDELNWPIIKNHIIEKNLPSKIIEHRENFGIIKSLNQVLSIANGKYLIGCSDDVMLPKRIHDDVLLFEELPDEYAVLYSIAQYVDESGDKKAMLFPTFSFDQNPEDFNSLLFIKNPICAPASTLKKETINKVGGFDNQFLFEDYPMWFKLNERGYKFKFLPEINTLYRAHSNAFTQKKNDILNFEVVRIQLNYAKTQNDNDRILQNIYNYIKKKPSKASLDMSLMYNKKNKVLLLSIYILIHRIPYFRRFLLKYFRQLLGMI